MALIAVCSQPCMNRITHYERRGKWCYPICAHHGSIVKKAGGQIHKLPPNGTFAELMLKHGMALAQEHKCRMSGRLYG